MTYLRRRKPVSNGRGVSGLDVSSGKSSRDVGWEHSECPLALCTQMNCRGIVDAENVGENEGCSCSADSCA